MSVGSDSAVDRLGKPPRQIPLEAIGVAVLILLSGVLAMFGAFAAFIWAAVDLAIGEASAPKDLHALWFVPLGTLILAFVCGALAFWRQRSTMTASLAVFSLGMAAFMLAISPYY